MKPHVLITGTSSGIGLDCARLLIENGFQVIGTVRQAADGERVREQLGSAFTPLLLDVTDLAGIPAAIAEVSALVGDNGLAALVNNAGIASPNAPLGWQPIAEVRAMFEVNVLGLLAMTQACLPLLGARRGAPRPGRIVNIGSTSGAIATPMAGSYAISKFAVEALSDSLRRELSIYGIQVAVIEPGPIRTPIWGKAEGDQRFAQGDFAPAMQALSSLAAKMATQGAPVASVSSAVLHAISRPRARPRYPLNPMWWLNRLLPTRLFDRLLCARFGLRRLG
ncbi:SDR family NAD(P)-dependent oxidoreductase [Pseudomonas sp. N040]|uniref:SDR family NAD(P)-dependent oxidoreductase n=1 Tax=Pseudomonas sp. N040 TaxID=2785325 RepID=UPI0018A26C76|nr:SDR family NAD(P)-dependent oxidoreductase [Pseudomonas sp. N040]MBF7729044.1 SDR family NAD(P)-dependent oxidoreductase [Pseudomonas sp. N040]MBW7012684.1 SDR family NAD(P)-dependent oxidoreductase [Pseudomonas sp. N040]